jgi:hypothetical protein
VPLASMSSPGADTHRIIGHAMRRSVRSLYFYTTVLFSEAQNLDTCCCSLQSNDLQRIETTSDDWQRLHVSGEEAQI